MIDSIVSNVDYSIDIEKDGLGDDAIISGFITILAAK